MSDYLCEGRLHVDDQNSFLNHLDKIFLIEYMVCLDLKETCILLKMNEQLFEGLHKFAKTKAYSI